MRNLMVIGLFLCGLAPSFAQDEYKRAMELYKRGSYKDALALVDEAIATHPDWWYPILLKGQCNQKLGNLEEALRNFNDCLTLEVPTNNIPKVKHFIARTYMEKKDYGKAAKSFTELIPLAPASKHFDLYYNRGQCEMQAAKASENRDKAKAKSFYSKAIVSFSESLGVTSNRKDLQIEASFQKAYAQYKIGNLQGGMQSLERSITAFQDVITRNPREQRAHEFIINLQLDIVNKSKGEAKVKAYKQVVTFIDRYLKNWPKDDEMLKKKGLSLQGAKNYKEAINVFELVLRTKPKDGDVYFSLGSCQMADRQYKKAVTSLEKAISNGKASDPRIYSYIANCYSKRKTKCYNTDIPLETSSVAILGKGVKNLSGQAKSAIKQQLERKRENLTILQTNLATDNQNHANAMENIRSFKRTISGNTAKLATNNERMIAQPTEELRAAIDQSKITISEDKASLAKEIKTVKGYIKEIKKCGNTQLFTHYKDMQAQIKASGE